jgi:2-keto-4-pentenoate hydratase
MDCLIRAYILAGDSYKRHSYRRCGKLTNDADKISCRDEHLQEFSGVHPAGNPRAPLYWLVEFLRNRGQGLRAGQAIITGSYAGSPDVPLHEDISVSFGQLGELHVRFISKTPA